MNLNAKDISDISAKSISQMKIWITHISIMAVGERKVKKTVLIRESRVLGEVVMFTSQILSSTRVWCINPSFFHLRINLLKTIFFFFSLSVPQLWWNFAQSKIWLISNSIQKEKFQIFTFHEFLSILVKPGIPGKFNF